MAAPPFYNSQAFQYTIPDEQSSPHPKYRARPTLAPRISMPAIGSSFHPISPQASSHWSASSPRSSDSPRNPTSPVQRPPILQGYGDPYKHRRTPLGVDSHLSPGIYTNSLAETNSLYAVEADESDDGYYVTSSEHISARNFGELDLEWETIFDAANHRYPGIPPTWFKDDWEVAGVYPKHILFIERAKKKKKLRVFDIEKQTMNIIDLKYETAGLSFDAQYLLTFYGGTLYFHNAHTRKIIKKFKTKNMTIRKWTSNVHEFCWVDTEGKFWRWSYTDPKEDPEVVFRLAASAPRVWLTPTTSLDGSWYAICASEKDRRVGTVHCFPSDNSQNHVFEGPCAMTFTEIPVAGGKRELAAMLMSVKKDDRRPHIAIDIYGFGKGSRLHRQSLTDITVTVAMKLVPEMFVDHGSSLVVGAVSAGASEGSLALLFDPLTSACVASRRLVMPEGDRISCGPCGLHMEQAASVFKRLIVRPDGLARPDSAGTGAGLAIIPGLRSRRSFETTTSVSHSGSSSQHPALWDKFPAPPGAPSMRSWTIKSSASAGEKNQKKPSEPKIYDIYNRANMMIPDDEAWIFERRK